MDVVSVGQTIYRLLEPSPLEGLRLYQSTLNAIASDGDDLTADRLKRRFAKVMSLLEKVHFSSKNDLREMVKEFAEAASADQDRLLIAVVDMLVSLESGGQEKLEQFGKHVCSLVLEGTLQQQFFCKVATRMGFQRKVRIPTTVVNVVAGPMITALSDVIRLGAETTRDSAIEGMGALLQLAATEQRPAEALFPAWPRDPSPDKPTIDEMYEQRLERRRLMVLAVADAQWRETLLTELQKPIGPQLDDVRRRQLPNQTDQDFSRRFETVLYRRHDLLRVLPAIARQNDVRNDMSRFIDVLRQATERLEPAKGDPDSILIAHTRYEESVFRTIDNLMRRDVSPKEFDEVVARAVQSIPLTMTGTPRVCNARVRTTVSILRTAIRVVVLSGNDKSDTKANLLELFRYVREPRMWLNLGVVEACYRGLPELLRHRIHSDLYTRPLNVLMTQVREWPVSDLAAAHRKLVLISCFRRILVSLADSVYERHLQRDIEEAARDEANVDDELRRLLSKPTSDSVIESFQDPNSHEPANEGSGRRDIHVDVIAAIGHESETLKKLGPLFQRWKERPPEENLVLTRILALQLHALSRDAQEIARHPRLSNAFADMAPAAMPHDDAMKKMWDLLATLNPDAAEAADPDIQRFVEYRGRRYRADGKVEEEAVEDLPGYVLAMISRETSDRIAGAIAREIDLNLRHVRDSEPDADFAEPLYQVMQRGPHESIFHHLMPRIGEGKHGTRDRQIVKLFESHVKIVLDAKTKPARELIEDLSSHVIELSDQLKALAGPMLTGLARALEIFGELASEADEQVWTAIQDNKLAEFFHTLDKLDARAHKDEQMLTLLEKPWEAICKELEAPERAIQLPNEDSPWRSLLIYRHFTRLLDLRTRVKHYVDLPVENFSARAVALEESASIVAGIEKDLEAQELLQPPKRVLLIALMTHLRDVFDRAKRWYCIEARRRIDKNEKEAFWIVYALDTSQIIPPDSVLARIAKRIRSSRENEYFDRLQRKTTEQIADLTKAAGKQPPRFEGQSKRYEDFAVDWMASDLDLEALWNSLNVRWRPEFALLFKVVTRPLLALVAIMLPFLWAALFHGVQKHSIEGLGFWVVAAGIVFTALVVLARLIWVVARSKIVAAGAVFPRLYRFVARSKQADMPVHEKAARPKKKDRYLFRSLLPQLAGCIAAPMALIAKFDHSYTFPFSASIWAMLLLLLLAFLATRFYLEREVVDRTSSLPEMSLRDRQKVTKVLGVTISQAFGIAVLLSVIFADSHYRVVHEQKKHNEALLDVVKQAGTEEEKKELATNTPAKERRAAHAEHVLRDSPHDQDLHDFVGYIPHQAFLEWKEIKLPGRDWNDWVKEHGNFTFYPTIILSWTALGLFFGLVLEGIDKGEHLRRRGAKDSHA